MFPLKIVVVGTVLMAWKFKLNSILTTLPKRHRQHVVTAGVQILKEKRQTCTLYSTIFVTFRDYLY